MSCSDYIQSRILGHGATCKVIDVIHKDDRKGQHYAMKMMDKSPGNVKAWTQECKILDNQMLIDHENIIDYQTSFEGTKHVYILTKLCTGGELFDRVTEGAHSEKEVAEITVQMCQAMKTIHALNIVHRDLKPENFVYQSKTQNTDGKTTYGPLSLIDFGCAQILEKDEECQTVSGSVYYIAPEMLARNSPWSRRTGEVWKKADMWSIGVIIYMLVTGFCPFSGRDQESIFRSIVRGKYRYPPVPEGGDPVSEQCKNLISKLLEKDVDKRWSAEQALEHPFLQKDCASPKPLHMNVIEAIRNFRDHSRLKNAVARSLVGRMRAIDQEHMLEFFCRFDKDGDGKISASELADMMEYLGKTDPASAQDLLQRMDTDGDGAIDSSEFLPVYTLSELGKDEHRDAKIFNEIDADGDGELSPEELQQMCQFMTFDACQLAIKESDEDQNGTISIDEFKEAMRVQARMQLSPHDHHTRDNKIPAKSATSLNDPLQTRSRPYSMVALGYAATQANKLRRAGSLRRLVSGEPASPSSTSSTMSSPKSTSSSPTFAASIPSTCLPPATTTESPSSDDTKESSK